MIRVSTLFVAALLVLCVVRARAHEPNTSITELRVADAEIHVRLRFDLDALRRIVPLDTNRDGRISRQETAAQDGVILAFLSSAVSIDVDDEGPGLGVPHTPSEWTDPRQSIPAVDYAQTLVGYSFRRPVPRRPERITLLYDFWDVLGRHHVHFATVQQDFYDDFEIVFRSSEPDFDFYTEAPPSQIRQIGRFVRLGAEHILIGWDHLAFLLGLLVAARGRQLVAVVTAFTLAHAITLSLAALEVAALPVVLVEGAIAATIVYVGLENLIRGASGAGHRVALVFVFGLVHGLGFASVLRERGLPRGALGQSLISFNLGIELGQLAFVALAFPLVLGLRTWMGADRLTRVFSAPLVLLGVAWLIDRVLGLDLMF